jgi:stearoyl-CoA desaturase (Delta-9 desaturase)
MSTATLREPKPPLIWANTLMFVLTGAIALVAVPWYGLTHGFTMATWIVAVLLAGANGMAITAG